LLSWSLKQPVVLTTQDSIQPFKGESKEVVLAGKELDCVFSMIEDRRHEKAIEICETVNKNAQQNGNLADTKIIKDKIFEVALEIYLAGCKNETTEKILWIADSPRYAEEKSMLGATYHYEAELCRNVLCSRSGSSLYSGLMEKKLQKAISEKEHLKCASYFLGKAYVEGLHGLTQNDEKAKEYFGIAAERGYEPAPMRKLRQDYNLMLEAQQSNESVFADIPRDVLHHMARLRMEVMLAQQKLDKKT